MYRHEVRDIEMRRSKDAGSLPTGAGGTWIGFAGGVVCLLAIVFLLSFVAAMLL